MKNIKIANYNDNEMMQLFRRWYLMKTDIVAGEAVGKEKMKEKCWQVVSEVLFFFFVLVIIFNLLFFVSNVPTESMTPTIPVDAKIVVQKVMNDYDYGDIAVFYSDEFEAYLVKRVIGKSGDKIKITEENGIYRNGEKLEEPYLAGECVYEVAEYQVPENCYFFLGDNRDESIDSRKWANPYISKTQILGEVVWILGGSHEIAE